MPDIEHHKLSDKPKKDSKVGKIPKNKITTYSKLKGDSG